MTEPAVDLLVRAGVVAASGALLLVGRAGLQAWQRARVRKALAGRALPELAAGMPTVLLFTGALCSDCLRQKEILQGLRSQLEGWRVREVVAAGERSLAARFGVESVPATVLLDRAGSPTAVNYGLVDASAFLGQLHELVAA
jgi:F plasmid transfer operon protein